MHSLKQSKKTRIKKTKLRLDGENRMKQLDNWQYIYCNKRNSKSIRSSASVFVALGLKVISF